MNWKMLLGVLVMVIAGLMLYDYWKRKRSTMGTTTTGTDTGGGGTVADSPTATRGDVDPMSGMRVR